MTKQTRPSQTNPPIRSDVFVADDRPPSLSSAQDTGGGPGWLRSLGRTTVHVEVQPGSPFDPRRGGRGTAGRAGGCGAGAGGGGRGA